MPDSSVEYIGLPIYREELARALKFAPSDLDENHAGRLGPSERSTLLRAIARSISVAAVCFLLGAGLIAGAIAVGLTTSFGISLLVIAGCSLAFVALGAWFVIPTWRDIDAGVVSSVEGFVQPTERKTTIAMRYGMSFPIWSYYWTVDGGKPFAVAGSAYAALMPARHRIYFLPLSRRVVAAEPV
jgi:hypothetical protein